MKKSQQLSSEIPFLCSRFNVSQYFSQSNRRCVESIVLMMKFQFSQTRFNLQLVEWNPETKEKTNCKREEESDCEPTQLLLLLTTRIAFRFNVCSVAWQFELGVFYISQMESAYVLNLVGAEAYVHKLVS